MRSLILAGAAALLVTACALPSSTKPVEYLDERTAMTVGALKEPIELVPSLPGAAARIIGRHVSFAYLGPIEWDRSGQIQYGLWVHVAPGSGVQIADIHSEVALILNLDGDSVHLTPMDAPQTGRAAYEPVAAWGQTAFFDLDVPLLKRMAGAAKLSLDVRTDTGSTINFFANTDTRAILSDFMRDRGITTAD